jgi:hypothetical protein
VRKLKRPSPALVISVIALFVALGSVSYAALGKNSVKAKNLHKNAVTTKKIKNNAVTTAKIANGAVTQAKLDADTRGQAVAWAEVNSDATIARSRGITASNISKPGSAAFFCLGGLPDFSTVLVSPLFNGDSNEFGFPAVAADPAPFAPGDSCGGGPNNQILVATFFSGLGTTASSYSALPFTIALFK